MQPQKRAWQAAFQLMEAHSKAPEQPLKSLRQRPRASVAAGVRSLFAAGGSPSLLALLLLLRALPEKACNCVLGSATCPALRFWRRELEL